mmetsp:Transcript_12594/g.22619  ORF Transcript_12594/g.22619 Transcript_12594/m.22619 type:complete len:200 (+) Transcript_12594:314-913(+)
MHSCGSNRMGGMAGMPLSWLPILRPMPEEEPGQRRGQVLWRCWWDGMLPSPSIPKSGRPMPPMCGISSNPITQSNTRRSMENCHKFATTRLWKMFTRDFVKNWRRQATKRKRRTKTRPTLRQMKRTKTVPKCTRPQAMIISYSTLRTISWCKSRTEDCFSWTLENALKRRAKRMWKASMLNGWANPWKRRIPTKDWKAP